jgi:hypothetical protein
MMPPRATGRRFPQPICLWVGAMRLLTSGGGDLETGLSTPAQTHLPHPKLHVSRNNLLAKSKEQAFTTID